MARVQDAGHGLAWYIDASAASNAAIDYVKWFEFLFVEHQIALDFAMDLPGSAIDGILACAGVSKPCTPGMRHRRPLSSLA
eukprot:2331364-Pyramimonas_sp.AAC.1